MSVNKVILLGRLGRDPETRNTASGDPVVSFSIATAERWTDKASGEKKEKTEWHNVVIWNEGLGKVAAQYLKKGSEVYLEGQMQTRKWTDKAGVEKYTTEVVLARFRGELSLIGGTSNRPPPADSPDDYGSTKPAGGGGAVDDDDIPF